MMNATIQNNKLSSREKEILDLLSKGNNHKMVSAELNISINTVRTMIKRAYLKLQVHSVTEALSKIYIHN